MTDIKEDKYVNRHEIDIEKKWKEISEEVDSFIFSNFMETLDKIDNPEWDNASKVHDWRNYIPTPVKEMWSKLSHETRLIAHLIAETQADKEVWE